MTRTESNKMTTKKPPEKIDGLMSFLSAVLKKGADLPEDLTQVAAKVRALAEEVKSLSYFVAHIVQAIHEHNIAIEELLVVQERILRQMKVEGSVAEVTRQKAKTEKPN